LGVEHRKTRHYTPRTNGMVERFNGRVQRELLGITIASHQDLETLLRGFKQAYNARRQRVLKGLSPERVVHERLRALPARANPSHGPPFDPCILPKALQVITHAKDVSHPDTHMVHRHGWRASEQALERAICAHDPFARAAPPLEGRATRERLSPDTKSLRG